MATHHTDTDVRDIQQFLFEVDVIIRETQPHLDMIVTKVEEIAEAAPGTFPPGYLTNLRILRGLARPAA